MHFLSTNVIKKIKLRGFRMPRTLIRISTEFSLHEDQCSECYETAHNVTISNQTNHGTQ